MSDRRLRELERAWKETASVEDEAAYLRERVRCGRMPAARLEALEYALHVAMPAAGHSGRVPGPFNWVFAFGERWGKETGLVVALGVLAEGVALCPVKDGTVSDAVAAARDWMLRPRRRAEARARAKDLGPRLASADRTRGGHLRAAAFSLVQVIGAHATKRGIAGPEHALLSAASATSASRDMDEAALRACVVRALREWIHGG